MGYLSKILSLVVLLLANSQSFAIEFDFTQSEKAVIKQFDENCFKDSIPQSLFPDIYLNSSLAISCEVSSFFGKEKANQQLAEYFFARYLNGDGLQYEDFNFIWRIKAERPGLSLKTKTTLENLSSRKLDYDLENQEIRSAIIELAVLGEASSIYAIYLNQYSSNPEKIEENKLKKFRNHLGTGLADVLFMTTEELIRKYPSKDNVEKLLDELITNSATTGKTYLKDSVQKFLLLVDRHEKYKELPSLQLLSGSSNYRRNIIRARLLTGHVSDVYFGLALYIELNTWERNTLFSIGSDKIISDFSGADELVELIGCLERFEEAALGVIQISMMWGDALCIQGFQYKYSDIEDLFKPYYPNIPFKKLQKFNFQEYETWLISDEEGNDLFKLLAFGDFRNLSDRETPPDFSDLDLEAHKSALMKFGSTHFVKPYQKNQIFGAFAANSASMSFDDIYKFLNENNFSLENLCVNMTNRMCEKIARRVDLSALDYSLKVDVTKLDGEKCKIDRKAERIIKFFARFYHSNRRLLSECSADDVIKVFDFKKEQFLQQIIKFSGIPNLNTQLHIIQNPNLYKNNFFSQISAHYNSEFITPEALVMPHQGFDYHSSLQKNLHLVDKAILTLNPISQFEIDKIDFDINPSLWGNSGNGYLPLFALAKSYENLNSYESAFLTYHLSIVRELHNKFGEPDEFTLLNMLVSAVASARNAGIPDKFIREYVSKFIDTISTSKKFVSVEKAFEDAASGGLNFGQFRIEDMREATNLFYQYTKGSSTQELSFFNGNYNPNNYAKNYGKLLSATSIQIKNICKNYKASINLEKFLNSKEGNDFFATRMASAALLTESLMFLTKCRNEANWLDNMSLKELNKQYKQLLIDINNHMLQGMSPYSPKYLPLYETLADMSSRNLRPLGAVLALSINKYIATEMTNAFVIRDSSLLRTSQSAMERIWTHLFAFGEEGELEKKYGKNFAYRFNYNLNAQSLNFHFPITSSKTRNRFVTGAGFKTETGFEFIDNNYKILRSHLSKQNKLISEAKDPLEYLTFRAKKTNHYNNFFFNSFNIANNFEAFLYLDESNEVLDNKIILNILYGKGRAVIQATSKTNKFFVEGINLDEDKVSELKKRIVRNSDFDENDLVLGCKAFKPIHDFLAKSMQQNNQNIEFIIAVPSVNLLPIPMEVILGSYCTSNKWSIVHAGDILAAIEFSVSTQNWSMPEQFIGVGNPTSENRGVKLTINLGSTFRAGTNENDFTLDLKTLPPLIDAVKEIESVSNEFKKPINLIGTKASIKDALNYAEQISQENETFILLATHGIKPDYNKDISIPSLLSAQNGELDLIETNLIDTFSLNNSVVFLSACDTAGGFLDRTDLYFTGFASSFANAGAKLILSSLWPVYSDVSRETSEHFIQSWKSSNIENAITKSKSNQMYSVKTLPFVFLYP